MIVAGALLSVLAAPGVAHGAGKVDLAVQAGVHGFADSGEHVVVEATITAGELIDGSLRMRLSNGAPSTSVPLQVAAGTTKTVRLVVATGYDMSGIEVAVVDAGGSTLAVEVAALAPATDVELVGVLPQLFARAGEVPRQVNLPSDTGRAELTEVDTGLLDLGPAALDAFDSIVGSGGDLRALNERQRAVLLSWVDGGGRLLLDDDSANDLLPGQWAPAAAGYALAGRGEVRMSTGAAERGGWRSIIEPSAVSRSEDVQDFQDLFLDPQSEMAGRAGVRLPELVPLLVAVGIYALVIGPLLYLVLRRMRRLTLVWVVLPAVAVLFTAGIVVFSGRFRSGGSPASSSFVQTSPAGAVSFTSALVFSRSGGSKTIALPAGWWPDNAVPGGMPSQYDQGFAVAGDSGGAFRLSLEAGQVANVAYVGSVPRLGLSTTASLDGDGNVVGTVRNDTPYDLHDVAVFAGGSQLALGTVPANGTVQWSLPASDGLNGFGMPRSVSVWNTPMAAASGSFGFPVSAAPASDLAELGIWALGGNRFGLYPSGLVRVAGWSDEIDAGVSLGSSAKARTVLTALAPIDPAGDEPDVVTVRASIVRSPFVNGPGSGPQVYRYLLPPGAATDRLQIDLSSARPAAGTKVAVWDGSAWTDLGGGADVRRTPVPAAMVVGGVVLVRITIDQMGDFDPNVVPPLGASTESTR